MKWHWFLKNHETYHPETWLLTCHFTCQTRHRCRRNLWQGRWRCKGTSEGMSLRSTCNLKKGEIICELNFSKIFKLTWNSQLHDTSSLSWNNSSSDVWRFQQSQKVFKADFDFLAQTGVNHVRKNCSELDLKTIKRFEIIDHPRGY